MITLKIRLYTNGTVWLAYFQKWPCHWILIWIFNFSIWNWEYWKEVWNIFGKRLYKFSTLYVYYFTLFQLCFQNRYGIMPHSKQGGSYPSATYNKAGNTKSNDYCMAVGVLKAGETADGWTQNGNGYDSSRSSSDWPNSQSNHSSPYVTVWLQWWDKQWKTYF
jgi:hypothetical protein